MPNEAVEKAVDDLIAKGRISRDLRAEYIRDLESNLQNDLLRGADYTNKTKSLAAERRQAEEWLNQERQKIQAERQRLEHWQNQVGSQLEDYDKVMKELPSLTARVSAYEQALKDYQIYDKIDIPSVSPSIPSITDRKEQPRSMPEKNPPADAPWLSREAAAGALKEFALLNGKIAKIQAQHMRLFGEPLDDDLYSHYMETGEDPERHWAVKYNVQGKREEINQKTREAEIAKMREEIRAEVMKDLALDPSRVVGGPSQTYKGGLTPVLEQYSQSRALAHSGTEGDNKQAPPDFVPPERRSDIAASRDRVARASDLFVKNFDVTGKPITNEGRELARRYSSE